MAPSRFNWVVLNQTSYPAFQSMMERIAGQFGPCLIYTGSPFEARSSSVEVRTAAPYDRGGLLRRSLSWARFTASALLELTRLGGSPFVLAVTNPPLMPQLAWALRRLCGLRYGLFVWDVYPEALVYMGWLEEGNPLVLVWREFNRRALQEAEVVITIGERPRATLQAQLGGARCRRPIEVVPTWVDTDHLRPIAKSDNPFVQQHGLDRRLTLLYSGNIGGSHGLMDVVEAAGLLQQEQLRLLFIGDGLGQPALTSRARRLGLGNVTFLPPVPWETLPYSLASGDIAVVCQAPGIEHLAVPSKTYSAMAAGSAIFALTHQDSDLAQLVARHEVGVTCSDRDPAAIAATIRRLARDPRRLERYRQNARRAAVEHFSSEVVYHRLLEILSPAVAPRS